MKNICFIPARGGSKGIKNKNIVPLNGLPLIYWTILAAAESEIFDTIYLSSNDFSILAYADIFNGNIGGCNISKIIRSDLTSQDKSTTESAVLEFLQNNDSVKSEDFIYILQPTSPLRHNDLIAEFDSDFKKSGKQSGFTVQPVTPFLWYNKIPMYDIHKRKMRQDLCENEFYYHEDGNIYACTVEHMMNKNLRLSEDSYMHVNDELRSFQIDTYLELEFLNFITIKNMEVAEWKKDIASLLPK